MAPAMSPDKLVFVLKVSDFINLIVNFNSLMIAYRISLQFMILRTKMEIGTIMEEISPSS